MRKPVFIVLLIGCLLASSLVVVFTPDCWQAQASVAGSWPYRKPIVIPAANLQGELSNFPLLLSFTDANLASEAQPDGDDICFVDASNTIRLNHEIEKFNKTTGELVAWVNVPFLSSTIDTTIYMYYGRSDISSQQNPAGVWDSNFKLVQHLDEAAGNLYDSTSNNNYGKPEGGAVQGTAGKIGSAVLFDGINDSVNMTNSESLNPISKITVEAWVNFKSLGNGVGYFNSRVVSKGKPWIDGGYTINDENDHLRFCVRTGGSERTVSTTGTISTNQWYYVAGTYAGATLRIYINGNLNNFATVSGALQPSTGDLFLACEDRDRYFNGIVDEVRISDVARDASWIKACYDNLNDPSSFISVGAQQASPPTPIPEFAITGIALVLITTLFMTLIQIKKKRNK